MELPKIEERSVEGEQVTLQLRPRVADEIRQGHFPGFALVPGALQIYWVSNLGRLSGAVKGKITEMKKVKFLEPLLPDQEFTIQYSPLMKKGWMEFKLFSTKQVHSKGRIYFE